MYKRQYLNDAVNPLTPRRHLALAGSAFSSQDDPVDRLLAEGAGVTTLVSTGITVIRIGIGVVAAVGAMPPCICRGKIAVKVNALQYWLDGQEGIGIAVGQIPYTAKITLTGDRRAKPHIILGVLVVAPMIPSVDAAKPRRILRQEQEAVLRRSLARLKYLFDPLIRHPFTEQVSHTAHKDVSRLSPSGRFVQLVAVKGRVEVIGIRCAPLLNFTRRRRIDRDV